MQFDGNPKQSLYKTKRNNMNLLKEWVWWGKEAASHLHRALWGSNKVTNGRMLWKSEEAHHKCEEIDTIVSSIFHQL